jgi:hypothetical protein
VAVAEAAVVPETEIFLPDIGRSRRRRSERSIRLRTIKDHSVEDNKSILPIDMSKVAERKEPDRDMVSVDILVKHIP